MYILLYLSICVFYVMSSGFSRWTYMYMPTQRQERTPPALMDTTRITWAGPWPVMIHVYEYLYVPALILFSSAFSGELPITFFHSNHYSHSMPL